ncbi:MAG TPA: hypothetical protein VKS21_00110 [Spirochaetota bacterium]|nr:hypothetical protein [Spirochaetota bacterium]
MKNFFYENIILIVFAGFGFLLSFIKGIFDYDGISSIVFKPLLAALIWFVLGIICKVILNRFIPELYEALFNTEEETIENEKTKGNNIDLTVDDDDKAKAQQNDNNTDVDLNLNEDQKPQHSIDTQETPDSEALNVDENPAFDQDNKTMAKAIQTVMKKDKSSDAKKDKNK